MNEPESLSLCSFTQELCRRLSAEIWVAAGRRTPQVIQAVNKNAPRLGEAADLVCSCSIMC